MSTPLALLVPLVVLLALPAAAQDRAGAIRAAVERLAADHPDAVVAVAVRDAATGTHVDVRADRPFHAASTMKVPVMIEAYRRDAEGSLSLDDSLAVRNAFRSIVDHSVYAIEDDSDDAIYERLGERMSVRDLVYQAITVSSNLATNLLIDTLTAPAVQQTSERLGTTTMYTRRGVEDIKAYRKGLNNTTTAADLAVLLDALRRGAAVSPQADRAMVDVLLDQRFNEMIPAGLPAGARAAHKTGWISTVHHDAAIVYPETGEPYVLVILTENVGPTERSAALGSAITQEVHRILRDR